MGVAGIVCRLRRVNHSWSNFVGGNVDWSSLIFFRVDDPGILRHIRTSRARRPSLNERFTWEVSDLRVIMDNAESGILFEIPPQTPAKNLSRIKNKRR